MLHESGGSLQDYIFGATYEGERLEITHKIDQLNFVDALTQVLDAYGLASRLEQAKANGNKLQMLDIGCGEGLFMHDLAQMLEERDLLKAAEISGIDIDATAITTAEAYARASSPARPYLQFYLHDATKPFDSNLALRAEGKTQFDFIYIGRTLDYLPNAENLVKRFYQTLKPGGIYYQHSVITLEGADGWLPVHPALRPFLQTYMSLVKSIHNGQDVAADASHWLDASGVSNIQVRLDRQPVGGLTQRGMLGLRNMVMTVRNISPKLLEQGLITRKEYDDLMQTLYRELGPHLQGQWVFADTLAYKPLN